MSEDKCMNKGCGSYSTLSVFPRQCSLLGTLLTSLHNCHLFTTTPTLSIPEAELKKLREDRELLDWLERWEPRIFFNAAGAWTIDRVGEEYATGPTIREAIRSAKEDE
jgi:hypothetical protein